MVAKITILEPHLEGAQIGPEIIGDENSDHDGTDVRVEESAPARERHRLRWVLGIVMLGVVLYGVSRSLRSQSNINDEAGIRNARIRERFPGQ